MLKKLEILELAFPTSRPFQPKNSFSCELYADLVATARSTIQTSYCAIVPFSIRKGNPNFQSGHTGSISSRLRQPVAETESRDSRTFSLENDEGDGSEPLYLQAIPASGRCVVEKRDVDLISLIVLLISEISQSLSSLERQLQSVCWYQRPKSAKYSNVKPSSSTPCLVCKYISGRQLESSLRK